MFKRRLIVADQASVFMAMMSVHISSGLVLHQMTSDHNRSELGIHDHSNEPSSSKLVPKVVPLAVKTATSRQELELLFHHHIAMLRTTGINPMIQPEPEDLPKDNPKLEIAVLRQKPGQYICCQNHKLIADIENDIMDPVMQCTTLLSHSGFSQQKLVSFVTEIHTLLLQILIPRSLSDTLRSHNGQKEILPVSSSNSTAVDDVIITENNHIKIQETKKRLDDEFSVKDLGPSKYFLGIEVAKTSDGLVLSQRKYTLDILENSRKLGCKPNAFPIEQGLKLDKGESESRVNANLVMSNLEDSTVTYTAVSSPFEGLSDIGSPGVDGPPIMPEDPYAYVVAAFQALPSPDYVPGPEEPEQAPTLPEFVPEAIYPEFMPPKDDVLPAEEQPLPVAVSPTVDSPGYIPESGLEEDPEEDDDEDPKEDPADYSTDRDDDGEEEPFGDEADDEDEDEDDEDEKEHPAPADSVPPPPVHRTTARISIPAQA
ncbi:putative reverse transcriptase domain-containing protein [Tanacetum coccineum]